MRFCINSGLHVCVDCFGGDLLTFRVQARQFLSRWFAPPLEGNLFPSSYCIDVFLFTLQDQHQAVACEGVYRLLKYEFRRLGSALVIQQAGLRLLSFARCIPILIVLCISVSKRCASTLTSCTSRFTLL